MKSCFNMIFICLVILYTDVICVNKKKSSLMKNRMNNNTLSDNTQYIRLTYSNINLPTCNSTICDSKFGSCYQEKICICYNNYANFPNNNNTNVCQYERKKQIIAFLLELLVPFGSSHIYLNQLYFALIKFSVLVIAPLLFIFMRCNFCKIGNNQQSHKTSGVICKILTILHVTALFAWMAFDLTLIAMMKYKDNNGVDMSPWN